MITPQRICLQRKAASPAENNTGNKEELRSQADIDSEKPKYNNSHLQVNYPNIRVRIKRTKKLFQLFKVMAPILMNFLSSH